MTPTALIWYVPVPFFGVLMCAAPAVTRPTLRFGVRVPPAHADAAVIRRQQHAYYWRSAAVAVCCTAIAVALRGYGSWWLPRSILLAEVAADVGCFWLARKKITAAKTAEGWFAGLRQTVVADTSWRTQPQPFPVRWLVPAITVIAATAITGAIHYPHLPAHLATGLAAAGGHRVPKSPFSAFAVVIAQLYVTAMWTGLLALVYRSRPDIDAADPAASLRRYRRLLSAYSRAALMLLALLDVSLLLAALQLWRVYHLPGGSAALVLVPFAAGVLILVVVAMRASRDRVVLPDNMNRPGPAAGTDRDDDRFWKAGLVYVNRGDPAVMVAARFGLGWTLNLGNPAAWLLIGGILASATGLAVLRIAAGM
jgi:uncharacterized membrane protein